MTTILASASSPEIYDHMNNIVQGASMTQILSTVFLGALFVIGMIWIVWKIIDFRLQPLADVPKNLVDIKISLSKMWSGDQLDDRIDNRINEAIHEHEAEFHRCSPPLANRKSSQQD